MFSSISSTKYHRRTQWKATHGVSLYFVFAFHFTLPYWKICDVILTRRVVACTQHEILGNKLYFITNQFGKLSIFVKFTKKIEKKSFHTQILTAKQRKPIYSCFFSLFLIHFVFVKQSDSYDTFNCIHTYKITTIPHFFKNIYQNHLLKNWLITTVEKIFGNCQNSIACSKIAC